MSITSVDLLSFATDCINRNDEVGFRNAISRSYYAAYHCVYPALKSGPKDNHQGLIDYLKGDSWRGNETYGKKDLVALGYMLQSMKDSRIIADYHLDQESKVMKLDAEMAVNTGSAVLNKVVEMTKSEIA